MLLLLAHFCMCPPIALRETDFLPIIEVSKNKGTRTGVLQVHTEKRPKSLAVAMRYANDHKKKPYSDPKCVRVPEDLTLLSY